MRTSESKNHQPAHIEDLECRRLCSATPGIRIDDVSVVEGAGGETTAVFTVRLSAASRKEVTVNFATVEASAGYAIDYAARSGKLTFARGQTIKTISVPIVGDDLHEADEIFYVQLKHPRNASIRDAWGVGTILNDDAAPPPPPIETPVYDGYGYIDYGANYGYYDSYAGYGYYDSYSGGARGGNPILCGNLSNLFPETFMRQFSSNLIQRSASIEPLEERRLCSRTPGIFVGDVRVNERQGSATFTLSLNRSSARTVRVNFATIQNGSARSNEDFTATAGTLVFKPRETVKIVTVLLTDDSAVETDETFSLKLSNARNAYISDGRGLCTIISDDTLVPPPPPPTVEPGDLYWHNYYGNTANFDPGYGYDAFPMPGEHY